MIAALRLYGLRPAAAVALVVLVPGVFALVVAVVLPPVVLGAGVSVLGALAALFAGWLYRQPVPEQVSWESALVCGVMALSGALLIAAGVATAVRGG